MSMRLSVFYKDFSSEIFKHVESFELADGLLTALLSKQSTLQVYRPNVTHLLVSEEKGDEYDEET